MKKTLLSLLLLTSTLAFAQENPLTYGVKIGLNVIQQHSIGTMNFKPGMIFGFQSEYKFHDRSSLGAELLYDYVGFSDKAFNIEGKSSYLDLPLYYKYNANKGVHAHIGVEASAFLRTTMKDTETNKKTTYTEVDRRFDATPLIGIGYSTPSGFTFDARYTIGLNDLKEKKNGRVSRYNLTIGWLMR